MKKWILVLISIIISATLVAWAILNKTEQQIIQSECLICQETKCEPQVITLEIPTEKIITKTIPLEKTIIVEVPKEVAKEIFREKVIYQGGDLDCRLELFKVNKTKEDVFNLYSETQKSIKSYQVTTTLLKATLEETLGEFSGLIEITRGLNRDYLFRPQLSAELDGYFEFASSSKAILESIK